MASKCSYSPVNTLQSTTKEQCSRYTSAAFGIKKDFAYLFQCRKYFALYKVPNGCAHSFSALLMGQRNATRQHQTRPWRWALLRPHCRLHNEDAQVLQATGGPMSSYQVSRLSNERCKLHTHTQIVVSTQSKPHLMLQCISAITICIPSGLLFSIWGELPLQVHWSRLTCSLRFCRILYKRQLSHLCQCCCAIIPDITHSPATAMQLYSYDIEQYAKGMRWTWSGAVDELGSHLSVSSGFFVHGDCDNEVLQIGCFTDHHPCSVPAIAASSAVSRQDNLPAM